MDTSFPGPVQTFHEIGDEILMDLAARPVIVIVDRYLGGDSYGIQIFAEADRRHHRHGFKRRTVGLFSEASTEAILEDARPWLRTEALIEGHFKGLLKLYPQAAQFVRDQVIPLEWKSMDDDELSDRVTFMMGV